MQADADIELIGHFTFGQGGSVTPYLGNGWCDPEHGFTWTSGTSSDLCLPFTPRSGMVLLELSLTPMLLPPMLTDQRVVLTVNGAQVASLKLSSQWVLGFDLSPHLQANADTLDIVLECPDATVPAAVGSGPDTRRLGVAVNEILIFATPAPAPFTPRLRGPLQAPPDRLPELVRGLTGLGIPDLAQCFESLGHNCEFGLAQRQMGLETLGMLRFGGISPQKLVEGLDDHFAQLTEPGNLMGYIAETAPEDRGKPGEIIVRDCHYGSNFHSESTLATTTVDEVVAKFYRHLGFLRRKFVEDLEGADKIFVFQHPHADSMDRVRPILNLLRSHGRNVLLFVCDDGGQPAGTVMQLAPDLYRGWVSRLAPFYAVQRLDLSCWIQVCANTYRLWRETGYGNATDARQ